MIDERIVAVLDDRGPAAELVAAAVEGGSMRPGRLERLDGRSWREVIGQVLGPGVAWVWVLDGHAVPGPEALAGLLSAAASLAPERPLLLAGVVADADGRLHPGALSQHEIFEKEHSVLAAAHGLVQLRAVGPGSMLVAGEAARRFPPPARHLAGGLELREWTIRILREPAHTGYLVPTSRAVRSSPAIPERRLWPARLALLASPGWSATERLWETYRLGPVILSGPGAAPGAGGRPAPRAGRSRAPAGSAG